MIDDEGLKQVEAWTQKHFKQRELNVFDVFFGGAELLDQIEDMDKIIRDQIKLIYQLELQKETYRRLWEKALEREQQHNDRRNICSE